MNPAEFSNIARAEEDLWWYRGMRGILFRMLDPLAGGRRFSRVLEAGCGTAYMSRVVEQRYGWPVYAVDRAWESFEHSKWHDVQRSVQGDVRALPFPDAAFDAVLSLDVLVHVPLGEEGCAMAEMARVLAPAGLLVIRVAALDILRSRHSAAVMESQRFTRGRLVRLAEECGIRPLRATYANSLLMPVALAKFRLWEPLVRKPPASGVEPVPAWLDSLLYAPLAIEARWIGSGRNLPLGQSLILIGCRL
jgi:SAM-dependent methyltransferase